MNMNLRYRLDAKDFTILSFVGVYDVFSASIAAKYYDGLFISGFSFAASFYGLPDIGFIAWSDLVAFVQRIRQVLPQQSLLVDIDDGYADPEVACHVVSLLESAGAAGVVLEDQQRPRKCGHYDGKRLMELDEFLLKLKKVLKTRRNMAVVARTDAVEAGEIMRRARAFADTEADAILVDGIRDLGLVRNLVSECNKPVAFNQIAGGKSPICNLTQLQEAGVSIVIYSTPSLFAAQGAVEGALKSLKESNGFLNADRKDSLDLQKCTNILNENLGRRDTDG